MNDRSVLPQYDVYKLKPEELIITLLLAVGICFLIGLIFYENLVIAAFLSLAGILYIPFYKKEQLRKKKETLTIQFKDALYFLSVSLSAGKSIETAMSDTYKAMLGIYPDKNSDIIKELEIVNHKILMNEPIEKVFYDLAERSKIEDIKSFADVIMISKRAGGNLIEVIKNTSDTIREKVEIQNEIENLISGKKFEQKVMSIVPFGLVLFLKSSGSDYLEPLMATPFGRIIMTIALIMILSGQLIGHKIMNIEV
ncbi:MAG TPA: pilus assembly protein TadB [Clostridiaceae bacterium]|nr:pilus assembly protein TadB [Clostridiaceae bacterium]